MSKFLIGMCVCVSWRWHYFSLWGPFVVKCVKQWFVSTRVWVSVDVVVLDVNCLSFGTWCHYCVARCQCVTALELTDESTEPETVIAFGCKQTFHTNFTTWGCAVHIVYYFSFPFFVCFVSSSAAVQYCVISLLSFSDICSLFRSFILL